MLSACVMNKTFDWCLGGSPTTHIFCGGAGVVYSVDTLANHSGALLEEQSSLVLTHHIGKSGQQSIARLNVFVQGPVDCIQQVQRL